MASAAAAAAAAAAEPVCVRCGRDETDYLDQDRRLCAALPPPAGCGHLLCLGCLAQTFAARLPVDREGLLVNILDQRVWNPTPEFFSYSLAKSALWDATVMMARALAPRIRVNAIGPGPVLASVHQTPDDFNAEARATPLGHAASPAEVAQALAYLIDARSVTGQMIAVDSGQHLAPERP